MKEIWKKIPGFNGFYDVSSLGRIRSYYSRGHSKKNKRPKILNYKTKYNEYLCVGLMRDKKQVMIRMHRLVLLAFHGYPKKGFESAHLNGIKSDNRLENLKWVTVSENKEHNRNHGVLVVGENSCKSKIKERDVFIIRELCNRGWEQSRIAKRFGISQQQVSKINTKKRWRHLT